MYYQEMDQQLKTLKRKTKSLFLRYKTKMGFDELNTIKMSKELYSKLDSLNKETYLEIAKQTYEEQKNSHPLIKKERKFTMEWLMPLLLAYDAITKYVYENEVDRKRSRFLEAYLSTDKKNLEVQKAFKYWWQQTEQYAIEVTDQAVITSYTDRGIKKVKWNTQKDERVCQVCRDRNGKIYDIDKIPPKPHYGCRCWFSPVTEENQK